MARRPKGAIRKARATPSRRRSPWQKKILATRRANVARRSAAQRAAQQKASAASAARRRGRALRSGAAASHAAGVAARAHPKPGTSAALARSKRYKTLSTKGTVSSVGQYKKRLGSAKYLSKAQFRKLRPKGSYKKYTNFVAARTGQSVGQVRAKQVGVPKVRDKRLRKKKRR